MKKLLIRLLVLLLVASAAVSAAVVFKRAQKADREREILDELLLDLRAIDADDAGRAYIEGMAKTAHGPAIRRAFVPSGFMAAISGSYDVNAYQRTAVSWMIHRAREDGALEVAEKLEKFMASGSRLDLSPVESSPSGG